MLVVAARKISELPLGLRDSKKLSKAQREKLYLSITNSCELGEGWVSPAEIDEHGLTTATKLGVKRALSALGALPAEKLIIDGHINYAPDKFKNVETIIGADELVAIVSAASIYAKVTRDRYMQGVARAYPEYGFDKHVGYGTASHLAAIKLLGSIDELHRLSFAPFKEMANEA